MNLTYRLFHREPAQNLGYLDDFYHNTVSHLCREARIQYCTNLIGRLQADLVATECKEQIRAIKLRIKAAKAEIGKLSPA